MRITVIIPALNEEATVGKVVELCFQSTNVDEVIVVYDKSVDPLLQKQLKQGQK